LQIRLSSVRFVRPTQGVETFGNIYSPFCTLIHPLTYLQNFTEIIPEEPLRRGRQTQEG